MAGFIGQWGPRQEQLHPRGFHGRWIRKFNVPQLLPRVLAQMDRLFHPRTFGSDNQAAQYLGNRVKTRFDGPSYHRLHMDWDEANSHLQTGDIDESTQRYIEMMDAHKTELDSDVILAQVFTPEAMGFSPQQMAEEHGDFDGLLGAVIADRGYSATHIGTSPDMGPGKIQLTIAAPKGTPVIIPARGQGDRGVILDRDQNLLITRVDRNAQTGEYYMMAVVMPRQKNEPNVPNLEAPRGAGLTPDQREARIAERVGPTPESISTPERRAGEAPPQGAGGQVTQPPPEPTPAPQPTPQPAPAPSTSPAPGQGPPPRNEPVHRESVGGTGTAEGQTPTDIADTSPEPATPAPAPTPAPSPEDAHVERARQKADVKRRYRKMATSIPVGDALQTVDELRHKKQDPKVIAEHLRGIATDPSMEEVPADERARLTQRLNEAADLFEAGKHNQGASRLQSMAREMDLETTDRPGSTVDYDPSTMESVSDVGPDGKVEVLRPPVVHTDPDTGRQTVVSKGRVRPVGGVPNGVDETPAPASTPEAAAPEAPAAPEVPVAPVKKAAGSKYTPDQERRLIDRAAQWRGQERNDEERRIVREADKILARRGEKAAPTPVREPRAGKAPMAKKAAAKVAPAPAKKVAAPAKKAAPKKLIPDRKPHTHRAADLIDDANQELENGRDPEQVAEELRDRAEALLGEGSERLGVEDLLNPGRLQHSDEDLRDMASGDLGLINRMADDLEKGSAPSVQVKKAAPTKAPDLLAEREAKKLEVAKRQGERERLAREKAAERTRLAEEKKATAAKAKEERAAAKAAAPAKKAAKKAAPTKELTEEQKKAAEVQARADEAGLPTSVTELRAAAKEQGIRGFSTMRKEQLQRALLGEEVSTGTTKLQVVSPEKMVGHLERVDSDSAARTLLDKHTLKDLQALADQLEIDRKARKLTTKDKLKNAILEQVRGTPGTDFEPVSPENAVSIRDVRIPDGDAGDMLRRGLVEVDDNNPESLRDESERLESHATQLRQSGDRVNAALYQDAADRMGMRAQQISGMEEAPKPVKRAPRKAAPAGPRLTPLQKGYVDKVTKLSPQGDNGWVSETDLGPAGARRSLDNLVAKGLLERHETPGPRGRVQRWYRPAGGNPEDLPNVPETPAPVKKAAKAVAPTQLEGEAAASAETANARRKTGKSLIELQELVHGDSSQRAWLNRISNEVSSGGLTQRQAHEILDAHKQGKGEAAIQRIAQESGLRLVGRPGETVPLDRTMHESEGKLPKEGMVTVTHPAIVDRDGKVLQRAHVVQAEPEEADKARTAITRARKAVPTGSVPGARAQTRMTNQERADAFKAAWDEAGIDPRAGRSASRSMDEVRDRVHSGELSPEEGIRRLETDIDFNKQDLAEAEAVLRDEQLSPEEIADLSDQAKHLRGDIQAQEKASKFMRSYFRREPEISSTEAKAALEPEQQSWLERATPEDMREAARQNGLGEVDGTTTEEVFENALRKIIERELGNREKKKAAAAKKAAKKALPKAEPTVDPENLERLNVRQIGAGIDFKEEDRKMLDAIQRRLDAGESPEAIAKSLEGSVLSPRAQRSMTLNGLDMDARIQDAREQNMSPDYIRNLEEERDRVRQRDADLLAQSVRHDELARRLGLIKRPAKKATAPAAPAKARRVGPGGSSFPDDMPAEERARRVAQIEKRQAKKATSAQAPEVQAAKKETAEIQARLLTTAMERLESARTEAQVRDAVKGLTMPELKTVAGKYPLSNVGRSKESLTKALVDFHTNRANFEVLTRGGMRDNPIEPGIFSDQPTIPNTWGVPGGEVAFHSDGPVGQALEGLGQEAKLVVDGDSLENKIGKLATSSVRGQISSEQFIEDLKRIQARLPEGRAKQKLGSAIREIDTPKRDPLPLPEGTPAPMVELMEMLSGIPLARSAPRGRRTSAMDELQKIAQELANGDRQMGGPAMAMETRLFNNIHESYGAEGKFEIDRAVRRAIDAMKEMRAAQRRERPPLARGPATAVGRARAPVVRPEGRVRPALKAAQSPAEISQATAEQLRRITGRPVATSFRGAKPENARQLSEGILQAVDDFPDVPLRAVTTYGPDGASSGMAWESHPQAKTAWAMTDRYADGASAIFMNNHGNDTAEDVQRSFESGWLAAPGYNGTGQHEFAHALWHWLVEGHGREGTVEIRVVDIVHDHAQRAGLLRPFHIDSPTGRMQAAEFLAREISQYAAQPNSARYYNIHEIVAEAFAQVRAGLGSDVSKAIYDFLVKEYERLRGRTT